MPIYRSLASGCSTDDLQHPFRWVLTLFVCVRSIPCKVVDEDMGLLADLTVIYCLPAFGEEQKSIELFEQDSGGLMNRTQDRLTVRCEFT